jgi:hypothetical protein
MGRDAVWGAGGRASPGRGEDGSPGCGGHSTPRSPGGHDAIVLAAAPSAEADQEARLAQLEAAQQAPAPAPAPAAGGSGPVAELTKLKGLLDAGALTPDEFQAAKQRLLAGG